MGSSITITVKHANRHGKVLVSSTPLALALDGNTKVVLHHHVTAIGVGDRVIVKLRYQMTKGVDQSTLLADRASVPARQIIDQHAASTS